MNKKVMLFSVFSLFIFSSCLNTKSDQERFEYDTLIIGSGPGGLTAGIYLARAKFKTLVIEGDTPGGLLTETPMVENWPGEKAISGYDLMAKIREHAKETGCDFVSDSVKSIDFSQEPYKIVTAEGKTYTAKGVIVATGASRRKLGCPGELDYWGKGVSGCATCDAPFYRDKTVVVVGGGNSALTEAHHLTRFAKEVIIIHTSPVFHVSDPIKEVVLNDPKVKAIHNSYIKEIKGDGKFVTGIVIQDRNSKELRTIKTDGIFVSIGFVPNTGFLGEKIERDPRGYLKISAATKTSMPGVFAAGDVSHGKYQQAIVAAGDGCRAALDCIEYLDKKQAH